MNARILELIKDPKIITADDLGILESESEKMPYAQSIRAVYLYGIHLYKPELYKENLTKTAAYTTDKKILYQFINSQKKQLSETSSSQKTEQKESDNQIKKEITDNSSIPEKNTEATKSENKEIVVKNNFDPENIIVSEKTTDPDFILIDGEKNRLLYEGEENFLEEKTPEIDLEATKESGQIVISQTSELKNQTENQDKKTISEKEDIPVFNENEPVFSSEKIVDESKISENEVSSGISFNGIDDFLPEVKFSVPKNHLEYLNPQKKEKEKPIQKTENKITSEEKISDPIHDADSSNYKDIQSLKSVSSEVKIEEAKPEILNTENSFPEEKAQIPDSDWQPMQFSSNVPDALIGKKSEPKPIEKTEAKQELHAPEISLESAENQKEKTEIERPVFNVSFFGNEVSKIEEKPKPEMNISESVRESNVGTFINTWQSWLKIDRAAENQREKPKVKEKIIDDFIEKNPKISQLKEESSFVVKERKEDISHLMTETLAKLYTEQKLYSKAVKAYEILQRKHPEKSDYYLKKVEEVKELRKS